jgi:hypothetical protein
MDEGTSTTLVFNAVAVVVKGDGGGGVEDKLSSVLVFVLAMRVAVGSVRSPTLCIAYVSISDGFAMAFPRLKFPVLVLRTWEDVTNCGKTGLDVSELGDEAASSRSCFTGIAWAATSICDEPNVKSLTRMADR